MSASPVVVGLDPERDDTAPLIVGAAMARISGAPLIAIAAYLHDPISNAVSSGTVDSDLRDDALARLEVLTAGFDAELLVAGGSSAARVLHEQATRLGASLIVVGSTGRGALGRLAPGTTAERLTHGAPCPVVIVPAGIAPEWAPNRVGVGFVDLHDGRVALRTAAALAEAAGGSLEVRTALDALAWRRSAVVDPYTEPGFLAPSRAAAQRALDRALATLPGGIDATGQVVVATPVDALAELSEDVELLVCGSRGYGPVRSVLLGGVTHALIRRAHCPVLVVPRGAERPLAASDEPQETTAA
jgi:nucleotide-binding universal stress UspA family protein